MGDVKDLLGTGAIEKISELAEAIKTCMFCTYQTGKIHTRPMSTQKADEAGNIWFLSDKGSTKNEQISSDQTVELLYSHGHDKFLFLHGSASIHYDKELIKELWDPIAKIWFTDGINDPRISVIKVSVENGYYWDTKHGKMVEMAKMAAAYITGTTMDDGIEGVLNT